MAEYIANAEQVVALNSPILFTASIPCTKGYVYHADETGIFILKGITNNCFARYSVTFNGNIAIPTGGAITPIVKSCNLYTRRCRRIRQRNIYGNNNRS